MRHIAGVTLLSLLVGCGSARAWPYGGQWSVQNPLQCNVEKLPPVPAQDNIIEPTHIFSPEDFDSMVASVHDLEGYRKFLAGSGISYPHVLSARFKVALLDISYGSPLGTTNRGYGVCDEYAVLPIPFLFNMDFIGDVFLTYVQPIQEGLVAHALTIYNTKDGHWGYVSQATVSEPVYTSLEGVVSVLEKQEYIQCDRVITYPHARFHLRRINRGGDWMYDDNASALLNPWGYVIGDRGSETTLLGGAIVIIQDQ